MYSAVASCSKHGSSESMRTLAVLWARSASSDLKCRESYIYTTFSHSDQAVPAEVENSILHASESQCLREVLPAELIQKLQAAASEVLQRCAVLDACMQL